MSQTVRKALSKSSKELCIKAAKIAGSDSTFLNELLNEALGEKAPFNHRASWTILYLSEMHPVRVKPHLRRIAETLPTLESHTQIASLIRLFQRLDIDLDEFGDVMDFCIHLIRTPQERKYVQVIAMDIILRFAKKFPELRGELKDQVEMASTQFEDNSMKTKSKSVLKRIETLIKESEVRK